jgi:hypothetical protein
MQSTAHPLVSVITVNYNNHKVTEEFLHALNRFNDYVNVEVIVVDNNSASDPTDALLAIYPDARIFLTGSNLGFAGGNNFGIKRANGEYFFLVNNDTEFTPGLLLSLVNTYREHHDAGIVCPKFHYFFDKGTIEYAGYNPINVFTGRNKMIGNCQIDNGQFDLLSVTNYAHGGGMLISRQVAEITGLMNENYFLYYEELDWSEQIKNKGFKIYYQPAALIYHKESASTGKGSPLKTYYLTRNRILFMRRWMNKWNLLVFGLYFTIFTIPKNTMMYLLKGQKEHLKSFWKGVGWHFTGKNTPSNI